MITTNHPTMETMPLPPRQARSMPQRFEAANTHWRDAIASARECATARTAFNGISLFIHFSAFVHEMFDDADLCARMIQHMEARLRCEFPPEKGKLL